MLNFILTIIAVLITAGLALVISDNQKVGKNLLAAGSTIGVFYALGTTVYWFLNFIIAIVVMYFYVNSKDIDETLLKTLVLTTTIGLLGWWRQSHKEGFYVSPVRYISASLTAKQCQDACEGTLGCKYAQVPLATSKTGGRFKCWNSYGFSQRHWGGEKQGGDTWRNKKFSLRRDTLFLFDLEYQSSNHLSCLLNPKSYSKSGPWKFFRPKNITGYSKRARNFQKCKVIWL